MKEILSIFCIFLLTCSSYHAFSWNIDNGQNQLSDLSTNDTDYWALIVGCNEFENSPSSYLPGNNVSAKDLYDLLILSDHWKPENIKLLTGKDATTSNIIKGLRWLDEMDDENDICLFYIATHGGQGPDLRPHDEEDDRDEYLCTYSTWSIWLDNIGGAICLPWISYLWDDQLSILLNRLDAKGVCAFFDTCYSGGFNDKFYDSPIIKKTHLISSSATTYSPSDWSKEFIQELASPGRIIITSSSEDKLSQGYGFIHYFLEALQGFGDTNGDNICTAEEAFAYAAPLYVTFSAREMNFHATPQIYDDYPEELPLTISEHPPFPTTIEGPMPGQINTELSFTFSSYDLENDMIRFLVDWGDGTEETTEYYNPGESVTLSHQWSAPGTFNIWFESEDEFGVAKYSQTGFPDHSVITVTDKNSIDQRQTQMYEECCLNAVYITNKQWLAQSFTPNENLLSQVDLQAMVSAVYTNPSPMIVSIRNDLKEEDLTNVIVMPQKIYNHMIPEAPRSTWTTFDFPDIQVIPGETYYIICRCESEALGMWAYAGIGYENDPDYSNDPYPNGEAFISKNEGNSWQKITTLQDFCFVTYGE